MQDFKDAMRGLSYKSLFLNVEEIRSVHRIVLNRLEVRDDENDWTTCMWS